ncbi:MAG: hypothetical protein ACK6C0_05180, partial [Betaproteobacteria bacterium]
PWAISGGSTARRASDRYSAAASSSPVTMKRSLWMNSAAQAGDASTSSRVRCGYSASTCSTL